MLTRRKFLIGSATLVAGGAGLGGYAFAIEPMRLLVQSYRVPMAGWRKGAMMRIAVVADLHIGEPVMPLHQVARIVAATNALTPDLILLLGDFEASHRLTKRFPKPQWTSILKDLHAPLGVHAVLGNHDWWEVREWQYTRAGPTAVGAALEAAGIPVMENDALRLEHDGQPFWLLGLGDQWAFYLDEAGEPKPDRFGFWGRDDLAGTLAKITDDAPAILMAHEPDIFPKVPSRVGLTISGHTHGGQVQVMGWMPIVPSRYGRRYAYGEIVEAAGVVPEAAPDGTRVADGRTGDKRHLIVSGGLGCSGLPIRFGRPPEIVIVEVVGTA